MLKCDRCGSQVESVIWVDKQKLCLTCSAMQGQEDEEQASYSPVVSLDDLRAAKERLDNAINNSQVKQLQWNAYLDTIEDAVRHAHILNALATTFAATHGLYEEGDE